MLDNYLPKSVKKWIHQKKELKECKDFDKHDLNNTYQKMVKQIDTFTLDKLFRQSASILIENPAAAPKYYNYKEWLMINIIRGAQRGLHLERGLRILDLGCGPTWFLLVAGYFGHQAMGVEIPTSELNTADRTVYQELPQITQCSDKIIRHMVKPFTPIPIIGKFDLITGFQICFNNHRKPDVWKVEEWDFLLNDLKSHLNKKGNIFLELNADIINYPEKLYYDQPIQDFFSTCGTVERHKIIFKGCSF